MSNIRAVLTAAAVPVILASLAFQAHANDRQVTTVYTTAGSTPKAPIQARAEQAQKPVTVADWLELQRSGKAASPHLQRSTAAERDRAFQRYLDSYTHPIPDSFVDRDFRAGD